MGFFREAEEATLSGLGLSHPPETAGRWSFRAMNNIASNLAINNRRIYL